MFNEKLCPDNLSIPFLQYSPALKNGVGLLSIGHGMEHTLYPYYDNHNLDFPQLVIKECKAFSGIPGFFSDIFSPGFSKTPRSRNALYFQKASYSYLKSVFGDRLVDTDFLIANSISDQRETNYLVQPFIQGKTLDKISKNHFANLLSGNDKRSQFADIVWASKKTVEEIGYPPDIETNNLILENYSGNICMIDFGNPKFYSILMKDLSDPVLSMFFCSRFVRKINLLSNFENLLRLSLDEVNTLDGKFDLNNSKLEKRRAEVKIIANISRQKLPLYILKRISTLSGRS